MPPPPKSRKRFKGFTLADVMISLMIIAEIATFSIPKIINATQNTRNAAVGKEAAAMIAGAYQQALLQGKVTINTKPSDLTPYMNYLRTDTSASFDQEYSSPYGVSQNCDSTNKCLVMQNGSLLLIWDDGGSFGGTSTTNAIYFDFDPDGRVTDGTTNGPGKTVEFILYYNGRISTHYLMAPNTGNSNGTRGTDSLTGNPPWLGW